MEEEQMDMIVEKTVKKIVERISSVMPREDHISSCPNNTLFGCKSVNFICSGGGFLCDKHGAQYLSVVERP